MKPNFEKPAKRHRLLRIGALMLVLVAGTAITLHIRTVNELYGDEHESQLTAQLADANQINYLLQRLNHGHTNEVIAMLKSRLASDLKEVAWLVKGSKPEYQAFANRFMDVIARDQKAHPEYYLLASTNAIAQSGTSLDPGSDPRHQ